MSGSPADPLVEGTALVTSGGVGARQLEGHLARRHLAEGRRAWTAPTVQTYRAWAADLWLRHLDDGRRQLLTAGQTEALWRRVIEDSTAVPGLVGYRHARKWAMEAARRLQDWNVDAAGLRASRDDPDCRAFLHWQGAYRAALAESRWMDSAAVDAALSVHASSLPCDSGETVVWADLTPTPAQARLAQRLRDRGHRFASWEPPSVNRRCCRVPLPEAADEVRAAAEWAAEKFSRNPKQRVAIVIPRLESRRSEVQHLLDDRLHAGRTRLGVEGSEGSVDLQGRPAADDPLIGAALTALELFSQQGRFHTLSRWLRSPFFVSAAGEAETRCRLETRLRTGVEAQLGFLEAFHAGGLAARIRAEMPVLADGLTAAVGMMDAQPQRATPTHWAGVWQRLLSALGWQGSALDLPALEIWESALNELTLLTPVLGAVPLGEALVELEDILARPRGRGPTPLYGVFVLADPEEVGPGYDALWVSGLTDSFWPRSAKPNPLLPLALQRDHGMPLASPADALQRSRLATRRLIDRVPEVVLSWPETLHEYSAQPSPLIAPYPEVKATDLLKSPDGQLRRQRFVAKEVCSDPVPAVAGRNLHGGVRTLSLQATCPLRAFLESRLRAVPLESVRPGLSAHHRGMAAHSAMQRLFKELPGQAHLASWTAGERSERIDSSILRSLSELFGPARGPLRVLFELEAARLRSILAGFLELDLQRTAFQVTAVEQPMQVSVGGLELSCRIDRIDELLPGGTLAVIDYKTGSQNNPSDWLKDRPRDLQLPLYATAVEGGVNAVAIALLRPRGLGYKGFWPTPGVFPGRAARLPGGRTWAMQLRRWRKQLESLADEFAQGDGRIFQSELKSAGGAFAPLTRVYEQAALAKDWLPHE